MAENSKIQWTTHTFNPWRGCTKVSPGCKNCYAETLSGRNPGTLGVWGPQGTRVVAAESAWKEPLKWDRQAKEAGERHRVFCASLGDVFEGWTGSMVDSQGEQIWTVGGLWGTGYRSGRTDEKHRLLTMDDVRQRLFRLIWSTKHLDWLLLTKRIENVLPTLERIGVPKLPANVWLGTSVENQEQADRRIPELLKVSARVRFLSCEPLLGPVDLGPWCPSRPLDNDPWENKVYDETPRIDWVIVGGESGHDARPCRVGWVRSIVRQCRGADVPVFVKQLGSRVTTTLPDGEAWPGHPGPFGPVQFSGDGFGNYLVAGLKDKKGGDMAEWPTDLRVRECPQ